MLSGSKYHLTTLVLDAKDTVDGIVLYNYVAVLHLVMLHIEPVG